MTTQHYEGDETPPKSYDFTRKIEDGGDVDQFQSPTNKNQRIQPFDSVSTPQHAVRGVAGDSGHSRRSRENASPSESRLINFSKSQEKNEEVQDTPNTLEDYYDDHEYHYDTETDSYTRQFLDTVNEEDIEYSL
jgi:hypothetical protein